MFTERDATSPGLNWFWWKNRLNAAAFAPGGAQGAGTRRTFVAPAVLDRLRPALNALEQARCGTDAAALRQAAMAVRAVLDEIRRIGEQNMDAYMVTGCRNAMALCDALADASDDRVDTSRYFKAVLQGRGHHYAEDPPAPRSDQDEAAGDNSDGSDSQS